MKKCIKYFLFLFIFLIIPINAKAVTFKLTKSVDNIKPGGVVTVIVNADPGKDDTITGFDLRVGFDASKLEFAGGQQSSKADIGAANPIVIKSKGGLSEKGSFEVARFNIKVKDGAASGNAPLSLSGKCVTAENPEPFSPTVNSSQITVVSLGTDASLSSLKIPNTTLKPGFNSETTSYTASITDITELTVNAVPTDPNAKISISENSKSLQKGENKIDVNVVSEDGQNRKIYTIVVTLNLTPTDEELLKANATLKNLDIKGQKIDFETDEKKYYITVPYETKKLDITATPVNEKAKVEIDGNKKLIVGKNTVKITITSEDKTKIETYQIIVTRQDEEKEIVQTCPDETSTREWILFSSAMLLTFTLGIVLGYYVCKKDIIKKLIEKRNKIKKEKEEPVEIETLSDTIDLSETVKKVKKKTKKKD